MGIVIDGGSYKADTRSGKGIAFAVATDFEYRAVHRALARVPAGRRGAIRPAVVNCGIGCEDRASMSSIGRYRGLISTGFAAALDPQLDHGSLLMPEEIIGTAGETWRVDEHLHNRLHRALSRVGAVTTGRLVQSAGVVQTPPEKQALFERFGASGADMESASLASMCSARDLPYAVLRVVMDPADAALPDAVLPRGAGKGTPGAWSIVGRLARRPRDLWPMLVLLRYAAASRQALVAAISRSLTALHGYDDS